jgi:hypothetical protein
MRLAVARAGDRITSFSVFRTKGRTVAKKPAKVASKKPAPQKPVAAKAKAAAAPNKPAPQAEPAQAAAPAEAAAPAPVKAKPPIPPRPVPPHQQFIAKGVKPQHMMKARIIRHQGR